MSRQLMGYREYARHREERGLPGTTLRAVQRAIETNRISTIPDEAGRARIDPAVADIQWASNTDVEQSLRSNAPQIAAGRIGDPASMGAPAAGVPAGITQAAAAESPYFAAKTAREQAEAEMAQLELAKMQGQLCDTDGARRAAFNAGRMLRDMLLTIPTKLAPELAGCTDRPTIERRLREELRKPLEHIARLSATPAETENGEDHGHE